MKYYILHGGCWNYAPQYCRAAYRDNYGPTYRSIGLGFRLIKTIK
jgi:formylglycine-generating enzyme required for sulfatase activity